jgi:predicted dehydrogenase
MLQGEKLDAVFILLPPHLHGDCELACAQKVPAVLVEKPIALDLATAERIAAAFARAGTFAAAAYMNRCRRSVARARELFAPPNAASVLVEGRWVGDVPPPAWWRDKATSGGQFVEQCTHLVDIARFVAGEIVEVSAFAASGFVNDVEGYATDDAMSVNLRFASGALGSFATGCYARPGLYAEGGISMEISSRETRCTLSGWDMELRAELWKGASAIPAGQAPRLEVEHVGSEEDIFQVEDGLFIEAAKARDPSLFPSPYADAMRTLAVTLAANESADTGRTLRI